MMAIIIFIFSLLAVSLWRGAAGMIMFERLTEFAQRKWHIALKWISFSSLGIGIVWLLLRGGFSLGNTFTAIFYVCCICIITLLTKNLRGKRELFTDELTSNERLNVLLVHIPIQYMFAFVWMSLLLSAFR